MRVKWLRGNGFGSFSSPHPRCSLFNMAADPETNKFDVIPSQPQVKLGEERRTSWEKATTKDIAGKLSGTEKA